MNQDVEELISFSLKDEEKIWINPVNGVFLVLQSNKLSIYKNIKLANQIPPDHIIDLHSKFSCLDFGKNFIIIGLENGEILQIDNVAYQVSTIKKQTKDKIDIIALSPSEQHIVLYSIKDSKLGILNLRKEKSKFIKLKYSISNILWLTASKFIVASLQGNFHFWNIEKNREYKKIEAHIGKQITALSKHPRSFYVVISGDEEGNLKIWDFEENKLYPDLIIAFKNHNSEIVSITTSKLGDLAISGDTNGVIRLWDTRFFRKEREIIFFSSDDKSLSKIVSSVIPGSFILVNANGKIRSFKGFTLDAILEEFNIFQEEINSFFEKIERIPSWVINNDLEVIIPREIPILEKNLEIASKIISTPMIDKIQESFWMKENFLKHFSEVINQEKLIFDNIVSIQGRINDKKKEVDSKAESQSILEEKLVEYLGKVAPGTKISLDQLTTYFNTNQDFLIPVLTEISYKSDLNFKSVLKKEYVGYFFEIISNKSKKFDESNFHTSLDKSFINCYNCGNSYSYDVNKCPQCEYENIKCTTCNKYIQFNDVKISCPHCQKEFHFSCFEAKVKLFDRCPSCRENVDFDSIKIKSVATKKEQENVAGSLSRLVTMKSKIIKKKDDDDDDDLFDF